MDDTATWPPALRAYLGSQYGEYTTLRRLYGLSHNRVWEVVFPSAHLIVKASQNAIEPYAYQSVAPFLGDAIPRLEWSQTEAAQYWLVLEHIPNPLPPERWLADPGVLALLHRMHQTNLPATDLPLYSPEWSDDMTKRVVEYFVLDEQLPALLRALQAAAQPLFQPLCWISGDPNRRNWGVRNDGTVVLYDWERLGRGTPALDLAITVPGLADWAAFSQVAAGYLDLSVAPEKHLQLPELSRQIALAKAWSLVEFLYEVTLGQAADTSMVPDLLERLLPWMIQISEWTASS